MYKPGERDGAKKPETEAPAAPKQSLAASTDDKDVDSENFVQINKSKV
jgi:hypothetical protein